MINKGTHKARGLYAALGYTSTGKEQVAVRLSITEGEDEGMEVTWYGFFTEKTTQRTLESLRLLGWAGDDLFDLSGIDQNEVTIVVDHEADQHGELRARARWINGPDGLQMRERMDDKQARAFAAKMKGAAVASRQKAGTNGGATKAPQRREEPPPHRDEDLPF